MEITVLEKVKEIAAEVLKDERILATDDFMFEECENWDSIHRVALLTQIEEEYEILFKVREISSWNSIAELVSLTEKKME